MPCVGLPSRRSPISRSAEPRAKPNIVFILLDDVGWADVGYNSQDIPTPFLDSLAWSGVKLTNYYVHPTCTPSRAALLTGRYASNVGLPFALLPGKFSLGVCIQLITYTLGQICTVVGSPSGLADGIVTLPEALRQFGGYRTYISGKWHLGYASMNMTPIGR